jgi:hypothetical protein
MALTVQHLPKRSKSEHSDCVAGDVDRRKRWLRESRERSIVKSNHGRIVGNPYAAIDGSVQRADRVMSLTATIAVGEWERTWSAAWNKPRKPSQSVKSESGAEVSIDGTHAVYSENPACLLCTDLDFSDSPTDPIR